MAETPDAPSLSDINPTTFALASIERRLSDLEKGQVLARLSALEGSVSKMQKAQTDMMLAQERTNATLDTVVDKTNKSNTNSGYTVVGQVITGIGGIAYVILKAKGLVP